MEKVYVMAARRRSAFALCREYGISVEEIAPVVGVSGPRFLKGLAMDGLSFRDMEQENRQLRAARKIMELLRQELETLSALEGELSSKAKLDALALLARTIDKVSDLQERFAEDRARSTSGLSADELRAVLKRIDERIDELAHSRARELVGNQSKQAGSSGNTSGMDVSGKNIPAPTGD
jgi:DNA mismatch repair ATPase MutS